MAKSRDIARLQRRLKAIPKAVLKELQPALVKAAEQAAADMRRLAPEDSGDLKDSIVVTPAGKRTPPYSQPGGAMVVPANAVAITAGNSEVRYPHLVEYGTLAAPAQPFFWPAWRLNRKKMRSNTRRAITKAIKSTRKG